MPRFVVLSHVGSSSYKPGEHWDLMLEADGVLRTWALAEEPVAGKSIAAEKLPDHRLAYLDYEGPVSNGDRGAVTRLDHGEYEVQSEAADELALRLAGSRIRGLATLRRSAAGSSDWRFELDGNPVVAGD